MPRRSKIDVLPDEVRSWLEQTLTDRRHPGYIALSELLKERGYDISHAAVHRHDQRLQRTLGAIRASTEAARVLAATLPDEADEHTAGVIRLVQSSLFEAMMRVREADDADPAEQVRLLSQAAQAVAQVGRASIAQKRWSGEQLKAAAAAAGEAAKAAGLDDKAAAGISAATLERIRRDLLGMA